jgi:hypothetical protein
MCGTFILHVSGESFARNKSERSPFESQIEIPLESSLRLPLNHPPVATFVGAHCESSTFSSLTGRCLSAWDKLFKSLSIICYQFFIFIRLT